MSSGMWRRVLWVTVIGCAVALAAARVQAAEKPAPEKDADWTVVAGEGADYRAAKADEVVVRGKMIAENRGKPGVLYFRAPIVYLLETKGAKVELGPPADGIFQPLAGKTVEVKGKMQKNPSGTEFLWAGWVRVVEERAAEEVGWQLLEGESEPYKALKAKEEVVNGVVLMEEDKRVAAPMPFFWFYLKTADAKWPLMGDKEKLKAFADLPVSVKGKKAPGAGGVFWVGWIRKVAAEVPREPAPGAK